ncbi:VOC family protein [soil metagenome]
MATTITPYLTCRNATEAYEFYQKAFGAEPLGIMNLPDGRVMHGALSIDGAQVYLAEEFPEYGGASPLALNGSPVTIHLQVDDCDAVFAKAVEAGCKVDMPLDDMFWGDRFGQVKDPYGHKWSIATTKRQPSEEEMKAAVAQFGTGEGA